MTHRTRCATRRGTVAVVLTAFALAALLAIATAAAPAARASQAGWQLPLAGDTAVLGPFDPPAEKWSAGHRGVDLAARRGASVHAAGSGVVAFAGQVAGRGVVSVRHGELRTTYQPVRPLVDRGERVDAGDSIGTLTVDDHCGRRSCLHWGLLRGETYLDPMSVLRSEPARLIPVWGISPGAPASAKPTTSYRAQPRVEGLDDRPPKPAATSTTKRSEPPKRRRGTSPAAAAVAAAATAVAVGAGVAVHRRGRVPPRHPGGRR